MFLNSLIKGKEDPMAVPAFWRCNIAKWRTERQKRKLFLWILFIIGKMIHFMFLRTTSSNFYRIILIYSLHGFWNFTSCSSRVMPSQIAITFKLVQHCGNGAFTFLELWSQPTNRKFSVIRQAQHICKQALSLNWQVFSLQENVAHNNIILSFLTSINWH